MITIFKPWYDEREENAVIQVLRSGWVGNGPKTEEFEKIFAERVGTKYAISCNSATSALLISAKLLDIKSNDEVIVPTITFISTAHIVCLLGAKPIFCDVNEDNLMLNWGDVKNKITNKTKLIIPVLYAGQLVNAPDLNIPMIYDCAHAAGSNFRATNKLCCWSFHAVKNIAIGDGGMITTDDENICNEAKKIRWLGINKNTWERNKDNYQWDYNVTNIGYKAHGNDLTSAIGLVQLEKLPEAQKRRLELVNLYNDLLQDVVQIPKMDNDSSWHLYVIKTDNRNLLNKYLSNNGVSSGVHYKPIHLYKCYNDNSILPVAENVWQRILTLPLYPTLKKEEVINICNLIKRFKDESSKIQ